eukprot:Em0016g41a
MINSLFIINNLGEVFMERHWKSVVSRSVCDYFFDAQSKVSNPADIPPVIQTPHFYIISIYRNKLHFLAVLQSEAPPLFVIEFLHRVVDVLTDYLGECTEVKIKDHYVIVYELLEEMVDNGFPLVTECNVLKELIHPPSLVRDIVRPLTGESGVSTTLPKGQLSNVPWRRAGIFLDMIEEVDAIIDKTGTTILSEIHGRVWVTMSCDMHRSGSQCHVTRTDLTLSFMNPRLLDDVSFHPCVRFKRWEVEKVFSFVPPDGRFQLVTYQLGSQNQVSLPVFVAPTFTFHESSGRLNVKVGPKQTMGKIVEDVVLTIRAPLCHQCVPPLHIWMATYDPVERIVVWKISLTAGEVPDGNPTIMVDFKISQFAASGLKVNRLDVNGEKYKPFKGIKYYTKAGKFQVRS